MELELVANKFANNGGTITPQPIIEELCYIHSRNTDKKVVDLSNDLAKGMKSEGANVDMMVSAFEESLSTYANEKYADEQTTGLVGGGDMVDSGDEF